MNNKKITRTVIILATAILVVDQIVKIWVKTHFQIGEEVSLIGTWCRLHFIENRGFAFGWALGGATGKVVLTIFRILASAFVAWLIARLIRQQGRTSLILCLTLIFAGAVGNIIDSCFYGLVFNESFYSVATLFPPEGGYAPLFQGRVVDMFYFPLFQFDWPSWVPFVGGQHFEFFRAIFNVADASITIGVFWLFFDQVFLKIKSLKSEEKVNGKEQM